MQSNSINLINTLEFLENNVLLKNSEASYLQDPIAMKLGVNEAVFLNKLHELLEESTLEKDGYKWLRRTYTAWQIQFAFWSFRTIEGVIQKLEKQGYIITSSTNDSLLDNTKWYRIDYEKIEKEFL
ncbi:hypothetical protein QUF56_06655 [Ureibacillus composti]|nr:hypothetical protein [Ureibacillus composti]